MKTRILCLLFVFCLLLSGCSQLGTMIREPVTFHYLCGNYREDLCCVIASEEREASGHTGDLNYLLALYLMGPTNDEIISPLPAGSRITAQNQDGHILLELSNTGDSMSELDFTLACACLTLTCLDITEAVDVTVWDGSREKTMDSNVLTLYDSISEPQTTEETE